MFGYEFVENAESKDRAKFIEYLKGTGEHKISDVDLRKFIEFSLSKNDFFNSYQIDCVIYPVSERSQLVKKILSVILESTMHDASKCSFELVKKAPTDIQFDFQSFEAVYGDNPNYKQMLDHVNEDIMPKIKELDYFSLAKNIKPKYRPFISNYLDFPNIEELQSFKSLKAKKILIVDDINTSGSTLNEILRIINRINADSDIYIYTLIGKKNGF